MTANVWPSTLPPRRVRFNPEGQSESGGVSDKGFEQVVVGSAGRWRAQLSFDVRPINHAFWQQRILAARSMAAHMKGRANTILIGPSDSAISPAAIAGEDFGPFSVPHQDGALFNDDVGYNQTATPAHVSVAADMGSATLTVAMEAGHVPQSGQYFGLKGKELYLIDTVVDGGAGIFTLTFIPTLRRNAIVDEAVEFDEPRCEMRSASDRPLDLDFERLFKADAALDLVEAVP